jgi:hypothetical protein
MLARAIADSARAGFGSGSALGPLAGTGRDVGVITCHRGSADMSSSSLFSCWIQRRRVLPAGRTSGIPGVLAAVG